MWPFKKRHRFLAIANMYITRAKAEQQHLPFWVLHDYVYLANAWTLAYKGRPLIREEVTVGARRPLIKKIYHYKAQRGSITAPAASYHPEFGQLPPYSAELSADEADIVDKVFVRYGEFSSQQIREIITWSGTPWHQHKDSPGKILEPKIIMDYYRAQCAERTGV